MPSIQDACVPVTKFPNKFVSPFGSDGVLPLYSSVPLANPPGGGCMPCIVCGGSIARSNNLKTTLSRLTTNSGPFPNSPSYGMGGGGSSGNAGGSGASAIITVGNATPPWVNAPAAFPGFFPSSTNRYRAFAFYDWDACILTPPGIIDNYAAYESLRYVPVPTWLVDGHVVGHCTDSTHAVIDVSTGNYSSIYVVGNNYPISEIQTLANLSNVINDGFCTLGPDPSCSNPTGIYISSILYP